jgi:hypothetical protein
VNPLDKYVERGGISSDDYDHYLETSQPRADMQLVLQLAQESVPDTPGHERLVEQMRSRFVRNFVQMEAELNARIAEAKAEGRSEPTIGRGGSAEDVLAADAVVRRWYQRVRTDTGTLKRALATATCDAMMLSRRLENANNAKQNLSFVCFLLGLLVLVLWVWR